ncbi:hypothetical protein FB451DRAFT_1241211 [Mycena latifolia]|nr:hypothetical protein FB451DRAFT_1241211 [Mycena latifolia]
MNISLGYFYSLSLSTSSFGLVAALLQGCLSLQDRKAFTSTQRKSRDRSSSSQIPSKVPMDLHVCQFCKLLADIKTTTCLSSVPMDLVCSPPSSSQSKLVVPHRAPLLEMLSCTYWWGT